MLMAVQQLNPDHESRVEALERAEKSGNVKEVIEMRMNSETS